MITKLRQGVGETRLQFQREDAAAGDIVAVGKASRDAEDLEVIGERRPLRKGTQVDAARNRTGPLEGMRRLVIAVGARCPQDQRPW